MSAVATTAKTQVRLVPRRPGDGRRSIELEVLAREAGLHPELVLRLVQLGVIEPLAVPGRAPQFPRDAPARLARMVRLRRDLGLNYAGAVLASQLLDRIEELEERLRRYEPRTNRSR